MRKLFIVPMIAMLFSCNCKKAVAEENSTSNQALFEVLNESQYQGREEEAFVVIKDQSSLNALYQSINNENVPKIDFNKQRVAAVFLGQRNSGGYAIKVKDVIENKEKIQVQVERIEPKSGESVTMAITNPYCIVKINSVKEIVFK